MGHESEQGKTKENGSQDQANGHPKHVNWKRARTIIAVFAIIEIASLLLWQEAEDFYGLTAVFIHWLSKCGFLAGGAFIAHKASKKPARVWLSYALLCVVIGAIGFVNFKRPTTDESGNPTGLLLPANDPVPEWVLTGRPHIPQNMRGDLRAAIKESEADGPRIVNPSNWCFLIFGENVVCIPNTGHGILPAITFHGTNVVCIRNTGHGILPAISFHGTNVLEIGINRKGAFVSGTLFGKNGQIVAILETNRFTLNRLNFFRKFVDKSTLVVTDIENTEVLNVRFSRHNVFQISGRFRFPNSTEVVVTKTELICPNGAVLAGNQAIGEGGFFVKSDGRIVWGAAPNP